MLVVCPKTARTHYDQMPVLSLRLRCGHTVMSCVACVCVHGVCARCMYEAMPVPIILLKDLFFVLFSIAMLYLLSFFIEWDTVGFLLPLHGLFTFPQSTIHKR